MIQIKDLRKQLFLRRHVVALLAFFGFFNVYSLRVNLSVAIVAMTKNHAVVAEDGTISYIADFNWSSQERGIILGSFFYGYILTQIAGGWLASEIGGAKVFGTGILITGVLTILTPLAASFGVNALVAIRIIEGFFEGVTYPSMHAVWARWAPPEERTRLVAFAYSGSYVGTTVAFPICGLLTEKFGWSWMFYIFGIVAVLWYFIWIIFVKDGPEKDSWITENELMHLKKTLADVKYTRVKHPWKKFFTCMPVWAIICAHCCETWGFYTMLTQLPTFMSDTLQFDIKAAGFLSALPYFVMSIMMQIAGFSVDMLRKKELFTTTQIRKICNCSGFLFQSIFMMSASFANTAFLTVLCITLAVSLGTFASTAYNVNHLDIAPQHAGVLLGISNTFATLSGIFSPIVTGYIVKNKSKEEWRFVFCIASLIYLVGAAFYGTFASGKRQSWAMDDEKENTNNKPETITVQQSVNENKTVTDHTHL